VNEQKLRAVDFHPYRWGDPANAATLPDAVRSALIHLGAHAVPPPIEISAVKLPRSRLPDAARAELEAAVGVEHVTSAHDVRVAHTRGWSTIDVLKLRAGDGADAPDAIVYPGSHDEVVRVLQVCTRHGVAVVPFAGGTSVVGGLAPARAGFAGVVALDVRRLDRLVSVDAVSLTATVQAGMRGLRVEQALNGQGLTLGHFPQSYEGASVGGYAAARSAGQASAGYGRFDEMVVGLVLATPRGTITLGTASMSAAGPDLRQLVLGSEGVLGVITSLTVRVRTAPAVRIYEGWRFPSFDAGATALRALAQDGPLPTVLRLSDEAETAVNLADPGATLGNGPRGCLAIAGYEGTETSVAATRAAASEVLGRFGGDALGAAPGEAWDAGRYRAPYLRDPLLDAGAFVETLETATYWSNLAPARQAVTSALTASLGGQGTPALVLCHVSHVYETGASLYFTVVCAQAQDPIAQWHNAKLAANAAIRAAGATITHHHGVGTDHRDAYAHEIGPLAVEMLRAVKHVLDPAGILNPGILVP
jgi:alkyldihydroxyacetonephosphate synthase